MVAVNSVVSFLTTNTYLAYPLKTGRTNSKVTIARALVTTLLHLFAWPSASRGLLATLYGRVYLCDSTGTENRLPRVDFAGLAESKVAEVVALVLTTGQGFLASHQAHVTTLGVSSALPDWTADFLALMLLAGFHLVAHFGAGELLLVLLGHPLLPLLLGVVDRKAHNFLVVFAATALFFDRDFADLAAVSVAGLLALVETTGQKLVTRVLTPRDGVSALSARSPNQSFDFVMPARTVQHA